jgi:hypothetical protein
MKYGTNTEKTSVKNQSNYNATSSMTLWQKENISIAIFATLQPTPQTEI